MYTYEYMGKNTKSTTIALWDHVDKNKHQYLISIDFIIII